MKYLILVSMLAMSACTSSTQYGKCIGILDDKQPNLQYEVSTNNIVWAALGTGLMFIPTGIVILEEIKCPVGILTTEGKK